MEEDFLLKRLKENGVLAVVLQEILKIDKVDHIIFEKLCKGKIKQSSNEYYIQIV